MTAEESKPLSDRKEPTSAELGKSGREYGFLSQDSQVTVLVDQSD